MPRGGPRKGAGRKTSALTTKTREIAAKAVEGGITPLDYMLSILRDKTLTTEDRFEAAKAAAPYVHPRLAAVEHSGDMTLHHEDALDELDDEPGAADTPAAQG